MILNIRKRPVVVQAVRWDGGDVAAVLELTGPDHFHTVKPGERVDDVSSTAEVLDTYHDTWVGVRDGQYVIKGVKGEFYPIDPTPLAESYEGADEPSIAALGS